MCSNQQHSIYCRDSDKYGQTTQQCKIFHTPLSTRTIYSFMKSPSTTMPIIPIKASINKTANFIRTNFFPCLCPVSVEIRYFDFVSISRTFLFPYIFQHPFWNSPSGLIENAIISAHKILHILKNRTSVPQLSACACADSGVSGGKMRIALTLWRRNHFYEYLLNLV